MDDVPGNEYATGDVDVKLKFAYAPMFPLAGLFLATPNALLTLPTETDLLDIVGLIGLLA